MSVGRAIDRHVRERAGERCEYCRMHQSLQGATFHVEHVIPVSSGGSDELTNLVLACPSCNLHKSDRIDALDPIIGDRVALFHPLADSWSEHFAIRDYEIVGPPTVGRATVEALRFNDVRRIKVRQAEELFDLFPPK